MPFASDPPKAKLRAIQRYINSLEYNFTWVFIAKGGQKPREKTTADATLCLSITLNRGKTYVVPHKSRGFAGVCRVAKDLMRESLPIKCLEAVFVGSALTTDVEGIERLPVRFRSKAQGQAFGLCIGNWL